MKKKILMYAALAAATTFTYGCNKSEENNQVVVSGITITSKNNVREIKVDETLQLTATVYPKGASQEIAWTSNDETKASVDGKGLVTALNDGMVSIKATSVVAPSISQVFSLVIKEKDVVVVNPTSVSIQSEGNVTTLKAGEKLVLTATVYPSDASQNVEWSSSDETIATVKRGEVTGLKEGNVTIKATAKDKSDIFGTIQLEVTKSDDPIITKDWAAMSYTTHEAFMASENETPTKIKGIVTYVIPSADTNVSYYIQNGVDGYYIYQQNKSTFPVELGKCYEVGGFKKYYNGLNEIINVEYFKELNETLSYSVTDLNDKDPSLKEAMDPYHNSYVSGKGQLNRIPSIGTKAYNVELNVNEHTTTLRVDPANMLKAEFDAISQEFAKLVVGSTVEFKGFMSAYGYGKPSNQIQIVKLEDLKFEEVKPADMLNAAKDALAIKTSFMVEETSIELPTTMSLSEDIVISWESDNAIIDVTNKTITHPNDDTIVTLTATLTHKKDTSLSVSKEFKVSVFGTVFEHEELISFDLDDAEAANDQSYGNSPTKSSYKAGVVNLGTPKANWLLQNALISSTSSDRYEGIFSIRAQAGKTHAETGRVEIQQDGEYNYIQFLAAVYGNDPMGVQLGIEYSLDSGTTWVDTNSIITLTSAQLQLTRLALPGGVKRVAIYVVANSGKRVNIDSIKLFK